MKTLTTLAFVAIATFSSAQKAEPMKPEELAKQQTEMLTSAMGLDRDQSAKLNAVMKDAASGTDDLRKQCAAIDAKINSNYDERMTAFLATLSPEQQGLYMAARKEGKIDFANCGTAACAPGAEKAAGCGSQPKSASTGKSCCASGASHSEAKPSDVGTSTPAKK